MPDDSYPHLRLDRILVANPRRTGRGRGPQAPDDPRGHARHLDRQLQATSELPARGLPAFDPRLLLKLEVSGIDPGEFTSIPGMDFVSQEGKTLVVVFANDQAMTEFRARLQTLESGQRPTRADLLYAISAVGDLTEEDRMGWALREAGIPSQTCNVDVELWPLERSNERDSEISNFVSHVEAAGGQVLDRVVNSGIVLFRVRCSPELLRELLRSRDVRHVDLPPRYQISTSALRLEVGALDIRGLADDQAPVVSVLDTGLATNHPVIAPAVGDAQNFTSEADDDEQGHGTMVSGIAAYGDIEACAESGVFIPQLRIVSGKVLADDQDQSDELLERRVIEAVEYFHSNYGCRIFNLSFGDVRKPYRGGHVGTLAAVLDLLSSRLGVLFVVASGNVRTGESWRRYPDFLLDDDARIIDPAPALNALTVGSLAKHETARLAARFPHDPAYQPVALRDQPSPFSRSGLGFADSIKPELVDYGGNFFVDTRQANSPMRPEPAIGELSTHSEFATGRLFHAASGTSYAAPKVAHLAGRLLHRYPQASPNLLRALLVAHARVPDATLAACNDDLDMARRLVGYGKVRGALALGSTDQRVSLFAEDAIGPDEHHFYEIPLPEDFLGPPARRTRSLTVALAHAPTVRRTRMDYAESVLGFRVVKHRDVEHVSRVFRRTPTADREDMISEWSGFEPGPQARGKGTLQSATKRIQQIDGRWADNKLFVVVTRRVPPWVPDPADAESYALVVVLEDESRGAVRLYHQLRTALRARIRV